MGFVAGYNSHLARMPAPAVSQKVSSFNSEYHNIDLYYCFKVTTRQKEILPSHLSLVDVDWECSTKYLGIKWIYLEQGY